MGEKAPQVQLQSEMQSILNHSTLSKFGNVINIYCNQTLQTSMNLTAFQNTHRIPAATRVFTQPLLHPSNKHVSIDVTSEIIKVQLWNTVKVTVLANATSHK